MVKKYAYKGEKPMLYYLLIGLFICFCILSFILILFVKDHTKINNMIISNEKDRLKTSIRRIINYRKGGGD